ncbi:MAG: hypothetical protein ABIQ72_17290 [Usitatibacter sp.]
MRKFLAAFLLFAAGAAHAGPFDADFDRLERMLRLKPAQKEHFDVAVGSTKRALLAVALSGLEIKERVSKELAKDRPDLNALYDIHDQVVEQNKPLFREARDDWSKLYAVLEPDQVAIAKKYIEERLGGIIK